MKRVQRQFIDWKKTGKNLQLLRESNGNLRRSVCNALKRDKADCDGECETCRYEIDSHISRKELAEVFGVSESVIFNWESGRTAVGYEDLLFYGQLAQIELGELAVFMPKSHSKESQKQE